MELRQLRYFLEVCKTKNMSSAASNVFISQQGMSKMMRCLEEELGVNLFLRNKTGVILTEEGSHLEAAVKKILGELDNTVWSLREGKQSFAAGPCKILLATTYGALESFLNRFLSEFENKYSGLKIEITEVPDHLCERLLQQEKVDIACLSEPFNERIYNSYLVWKEPNNIILNKSLALSKKELIFMEDLENQAFLCSDDSFYATRLFVQSCLRAWDHEPKYAMRSLNNSNLLQLCKEGQGLLLMPNNDAMQKVKECSDLVTYPFPDSAFQLRYHFVCLKNKKMNMNISALFECARAAYFRDCKYSKE